VSARDYHVDARAGSDAAAGTLDAPWRTLAKAGSVALGPGDRLLLKAGQDHPGSLILRAQGTPENPVVVSSYGAGRARIAAGDEGGILLRNAGGVAFSGLEIRGSGSARNAASGLCLFADRGGDEPHEAISVEDVEISGFGCAGVAIGAEGRGGFRGVSLRRVRAHSNAYAGFFSWGGGKGPAHRDVVLKDCVADSNEGIPGLLHPSGHGIHSGHGILLSGVDGGLIEGCRAHDNGARSTAHASGPAGIWASDGRRIVIRRSESFRNRTASATDGGGFGLDGGVTDSALEENTSRDNDGPGFLLAQYYGAAPFRGNRVVGNVSTNDARRNDNGAVHLWSPDDDPLTDVLVEGNTVNVSPSDMGRPRALFIEGRTVGLRLLGNTLNGGGVPLLLEVTPLQRGLVCRGNVFSPREAVLWQGRFFETAARWREAFPQDPD
jgi:hypothetical protein